MNNDPKELQPSPDGQQQPQQPPLYESQPPDGQLPYGVSPIPSYWPPQPPKKPSRRWLWITLALIGGLVVLTCIGSTIFVAVSLGSFAGLARPGLRSGLRVLLVPATGTGTPTPAALGATQVLLSERLAAFGLQNASVQELTSGSQPTLQVEVPHFGGDERATLDTLLNTGTLEFWNTGPSPVPIGSPFTPAQFAQYNPGGKAPFTGNDLDGSQVSVGTDTTGRPSILFEMKGDAIGRFGQFTQQNFGNYLTVTLDRKVIESAVIQSAITGPGELTGNFTLQHAKALASVLKYPSLPVVLHITSESSF